MSRLSRGGGITPDTVFLRRSRLWPSHAPFTGAEGALIYVKVGGAGRPISTGGAAAIPAEFAIIGGDRGAFDPA